MAALSQIRVVEGATLLKVGIYLHFVPSCCYYLVTRSFGVTFLQLRLNDFRWSSAFSIQFEGAMCLPLKSETGSDQMFVRVEVRSGTKQSRYEVIFRPHCFSSPHR